MKNIKNNRGIALFFVIATIGIVSVILTGMMFYMRGEVRHSENYVDSTVALLLAESGIEETIFTIKSQMNNTDNPFYDLVTKQDNGEITVDLSRLAKGDKQVTPIIAGGDIKAKVSWQLDHKAVAELVLQGVPKDIARQGTITINSMGVYNNSKKQVEVKKTIKALLLKGPISANSVGMIAPEHGLYFKLANRDSFKIESFDFWDPWGFIVKGGRTYMKEGVVVDLPKWLMLTKMKSELEHPWLDLGIGWTGWNGGADLSSTELEYSNQPINRNYLKWQGLLSWPWWQESSSELYHSQTRKIEEYEDKAINVYPASAYKALANRVIDPTSKTSDNQYFTNINFQEAFGRNEVNYKDVLPMYGWGDWRNVKNQFSKYFGNPTKAHDTSHAVEINGLTYVKGDVYLEGWVKGQGLLVVEGNVYIGGDVLMLDDDSGKQSCLGIIALKSSEDSSYEHPNTGQVIYEPHHDSDWSRFGITHPFRNLSPQLESNIYAQGGMKLQTDSQMKKLTNMDIIGNLAVDYFDRQALPNDVRITHYNWQQVLERNSDYDYTVDKKQDYINLYDLALLKELVSWREVDANL
jgi:hypothetical protein